MNVDQQFDKAKALITKYNINKRVLGDLIKVKHGAFGEKWYETRGNRFSPDQKKQIIQFLKEMGKELKKL